MGSIKKYKSLYIIILSILILTTVFLCYGKFKDYTTFKDSPEWSNELILTFNGHEYNVTDKTTKDVGDKIGTINYHGSKPNVYSLYEIKNSKDYERIAVKTKKGFLIAIIKS